MVLWLPGFDDEAACHVLDLSVTALALAMNFQEVFHPALPPRRGARHRLLRGRWEEQNEDATKDHAP